MKILPAIALIFAFPVLSLETWALEIPLDQDMLYSTGEVVSLENGCSVISMFGPFEDPFLICLNPEGELQWYRSVLETGGSSRAFESGGYLVRMDGGDFAACFHSEPRATGVNTDVAVIRMDDSGNQQWQYTLGEHNDMVWMAKGIVSCSDGGLLVYGCPGTSLPGGYALKLSPDGNREWMTTSEDIQGFAVNALETPDGDFILLSIDDLSWNSVIYQINSDGLVSSPAAISEDRLRFDCILALSEDSFWSISTTNSDSLQIMELDHYLNVLNQAMFPLPDGFSAASLSVSDHHILLAGDRGENACMILLDFQGNILWQREYRIGDESSFSGAVFSPDGIITLGFTRNSDLGDWAIIVCRTDSDGLMNGFSLDSTGPLSVTPNLLSLNFNTLSWIIACSVTVEESIAVELADDLHSKSGLETGYLWIPDWQSLSGTSGWLVYARPVIEDQPLSQGFEILLDMYADAYFIWASQGWERRTMAIEEFIPRFR